MSTRTRFIVVNTRTGKAVQNWSYADRRHIVFCNDPEWAMGHPDMKAAQRTVDRLKKDFGDDRLTAMKVTITTTVSFG